MKIKLKELTPFHIPSVLTASPGTPICTIDADLIWQEVYITGGKYQHDLPFVASLDCYSKYDPMRANGLKNRLVLCIFFTL